MESQMADTAYSTNAEEQMSGTAEPTMQGRATADNLAAELKNLSDEEIIQRYWTHMVVDDRTKAEFSVIEDEIRSRGSGLVPWLS